MADARTLNSLISLTIQAILTSLDQHTKTTAGQQYDLSLANASHSNNNLYESIGVTLAAGASTTLDLNGTLKNPQGETVTLTCIKLLLIVNRSADASAVLTVGAAAATKWEAWTTVTGSTLIATANDGMILLVNTDSTKFAVGAGTADSLKILNQSATAVATFDILILGDDSVLV